MPTPSEFSAELKEKVTLNSQYAGCKDISIDYDKIKDIYLDVENRYLHDYWKIKLKHLGFGYFKYSFLEAVKCSFYYVFYKKMKLSNIFY